MLSPSNQRKRKKKDGKKFGNHYGSTYFLNSTLYFFIRRKF